VPESKRRHERGQLRDSSVELAEPWEPRVGKMDADEEQGGIEDDRLSSRDNGPDEGRDCSRRVSLWGDVYNGFGIPVFLGLFVMFFVLTQ